MLFLIILTTFGCLALIVISVYLKLARPTGVVNTRLEGMDPSLTMVENSPVTMMAERMAEPLNRIIPISASEAAKLQKQLLQAGYSSPEAATAFRAIQITLIIALPDLERHLYQLALILETLLRDAEPLVTEHPAQELSSLRRGHLRHDRELLLPGEVRVEELRVRHAQRALELVRHRLERVRDGLSVLVQGSRGKTPPHAVLVRPKAELELDFHRGAAFDCGA